MSFEKAKGYFQKALENFDPSYEVDDDLRKSFKRKEKENFYRGLISLTESLGEMEELLQYRA